MHLKPRFSACSCREWVGGWVGGWVDDLFQQRVNDSSTHPSPHPPTHSSTYNDSVHDKPTQFSSPQRRVDGHGPNTSNSILQGDSITPAELPTRVQHHHSHNVWVLVAVLEEGNGRAFGKLGDEAV